MSASSISLTKFSIPVEASMPRERLRKIVKAAGGFGIAALLLGFIVLGYWDLVGRIAPTSPNPATGQVHVIEMKNVVRFRYVDAEHIRGAEIGGYIAVSGIGIIATAAVLYGWLFRRWPFT